MGLKNSVTKSGTLEQAISALVPFYKIKRAGAVLVSPRVSRSRRRTQTKIAAAAPNDAAFVVSATASPSAMLLLRCFCRYYEGCR